VAAWFTLSAALASFSAALVVFSGAFCVPQDASNMKGTIHIPILRIIVSSYDMNFLGGDSRIHQGSRSVSLNSFPNVDKGPSHLPLSVKVLIGCWPPRRD